MADKIGFKLENEKSYIKGIRKEFEPQVYKKIKVEFIDDDTAVASLEQRDFLRVVQDLDDRHEQKYGEYLVRDENWRMLKTFPGKITVTECAGDFHARNFYCVILEKFLDYVVALSSEGYII